MWRRPRAQKRRRGQVCERWERVACRLAFEVEVEADNERDAARFFTRERGQQLTRPTLARLRKSAVYLLLGTNEGCWFPERGSRELSMDAVQSPRRFKLTILYLV